MCLLIMLAQAQGLFYLKCLKTPAAQLTKGNEAKKSSICAKLAAHASKLYREASEKAETPALKAILNKAWLSHANFQQHLYGAATAFKQSEALHAKAEAEHEGFGLEIAWLVRASNLIGKANEVASSRSSGLTDAERESAGSLADKISTKLEKRRRENNSIYMETIPRDEELQDVRPKAMAKPVPVSSLVKGEEKALFKGSARASEPHQGSLGDCWFISALSILANRPGLIQAIFVTPEPIALHEADATAGSAGLYCVVRILPTSY